MTVSNFHVVNLIIRKANDETDLSPDMYAKLFREFYLSATSGISSRDKECLLISNAEHTSIKNSKVFHGQFVEYTNLDKRKWFNLIKRDLDLDFTIPEYLKANSIKNVYFFIPEIHRFCYSFTAKEHIQPLNVQRFLDDAWTKFLEKNYPGEYYPEINFEKEKETLEQIINADQVFSIDITVSYSNDFGRDMKEFFEEDMKVGNADEVHITAKNKNGESLNLDKTKILRGAIEATASHGTAVASIKKGKRRQTIKTIDHPAKYKLSFAAVPEMAKDVFNHFVNLFS